MIDWDRIDNATTLELNDWLIDVGIFTQEKIARLRLGIYDEARDGTLLETLEEIERILGNNG